MKKILFFTGRYCGKCYAIKKRLDTLIEEGKFQVNYEVVNIEKDPKAIEKYEIEGIPLTIVMENDQIVKRIKGSLYKEDLLELGKL